MHNTNLLDNIYLFYYSMLIPKINCFFGNIGHKVLMDKHDVIFMLSLYTLFI